MSLRRLLPQLVLALGAPSACTGPANDPPPPEPFVAEPPSVYVAKVKNILVGLPPTDDEVAAVVKDPTALPGLIDTWMALPQYQAKMMVFFELAFQQTQISQANFVDIAPPNGLGNGKQVPLLVQNSTESIARTMLADSSGQITDAFTTKTIMMTPALMQLYAYFEAHQANDLGVIADSFQKANPGLMITLDAEGPIPIQDSLTVGNANYMHFYNPDILTQVYPVQDSACNGVDHIQITANSQNFYNIMFGEIPPHKVGTTACPIRSATGMGTQLLPADFTDWKLVTIRPPNGS